MARYCNNDVNGGGATSSSGSFVMTTKGKASSLSLLLVAMILAFVVPDVADGQQQQQQLGPVGLDTKFNLTGPVFEFDSLRNINMDFLVSDIMDDSMVGYTFYDGFNCKDTDGGSNDITVNDGYLLSRLRTDLVPIGDGSGERKIKVNMNLDPEKLIDSGLYHEKEGSNGNRATIEFCLRFSVYNTDKTDPNTMEVNFLENLVTLDINLMNDFSLDVNLAKADRVIQDAYMDTAVEAFICDSDDNVLTIEEDKIQKNQGETVRICVSPTQRALDDGAKMKILESFTFYIPDTSGATTANIVEQVAIFPNTGGIPADPLTIVSCDPGSIVCAFETLLNANFFQTSSTVVFGEGSAYLQLEDGEDTTTTTGRRRNHRRNLIKEEDVMTATKMTVRTLQFDEDGNPLSENAKSANELLADRPTNFKMMMTLLPVQKIGAENQYVDSGGSSALRCVATTILVLVFTGFSYFY